VRRISWAIPMPSHWLATNFHASEKLSDKFYFHTRSKRHLRDPKGAANVHPCISKYLSEKLRSTIGDQVLFGERGSAVHEHHQLHDALDLVQVAHRGMKCAHQIDGHSTSGFFTLCGREIRPQLADPWFAIDLGDMARREKQIAAA